MECVESDMNNKINPLGVQTTPSVKVEGSPRKSSAQDVTSVSASAPLGGVRQQDDSVQLQSRAVDNGVSIDLAKVERLRDAIQSGQYQINARAISSRLLDVESALR